MVHNALYLSKEQIFNDLERFSQQMESKYNIQSARPYENEITDGAEFGYELTFQAQTVIIKKPYLVNENGDFAENRFRREWTFETDGTPSNRLYKSLGDVFEATGIKRL